MMPHGRRRFVPRVDHVASPGYGDGDDWRERVGLPEGGPSALVILEYDPGGLWTGTERRGATGSAP
jgi:hypothetical protein